MLFTVKGQLLRFISKSPVIVIGMHRSGTTFLADILSRAGLLMGHDIGQNHESWFFQQINEHLLSKNNYAWDYPGRITNADNLKLNYWKMAIQFTLGTKFNKALLKNFTYSPHVFKDFSWGWKDPRNTFTLYYWLNHFPEAKVIHIYRNGLDAAISLNRRNSRLNTTRRFYSDKLQDLLYCFKLWEQYVEEALDALGQISQKSIHVQFEKLIDQNREEILRLENFLELPLSSEIQAYSDKSRKGRFQNEDYYELIQYAKSSSIFSELGYAT